jgi:hypothetical protein
VELIDGYSPGHAKSVPSHQTLKSYKRNLRDLERYCGEHRLQLAESSEDDLIINPGGDMAQVSLLRLRQDITEDEPRPPNHFTDRDPDGAREDRPPEHKRVELSIFTARVHAFR